MTNEEVIRLANKLGIKLYYKRYRMWNNVPHLGKTALVFDCTVMGGGYKLIHMQNFPRKANLDYIEAAIRANAVSLGYISQGRGGETIYPWDEMIGKYPPGYFTGKVGPTN